MVRYLLFFSYIGTSYSGMQVQRKYPVKTVTWVIENALRRLCQKEGMTYDNHFSKFICSSRTDKGVHALCNSGHFDLFSPSLETPLHEMNRKQMTHDLNNILLYEFEENVCILETVKVSDDFHSRYDAVMRTYVYRICVPKTSGSRTGINSSSAAENGFSSNCPERCYYRVEEPFSLFDRNQVFLFRKAIDIGTIREATRILSGVHDFKAFTNRAGLISKPLDFTTVRKMEIQLQPGHGFFPSSSGFYSREDGESKNGLLPSNSGFYSREDTEPKNGLLSKNSGIYSREDDETKNALLPSNYGFYSLDTESKNGLLLPNSGLYSRNTMSEVLSDALGSYGGENEVDDGRTEEKYLIYESELNRRHVYWNFVFKSYSFLYKQIIKMMGVLLGVGCGDISLNEVRRLLNANIGTSSSKFKVPAFALYLTNIEYNKDFQKRISRKL